jgi:putative component of membrane protein insertase Oxa1/YidC/SpoIIIJ protein YidD
MVLMAIILSGFISLINLDGSVISVKAPVSEISEDSKISTFDYAINFFDQSINFYQNFITDIDGHHCPMHPSCSQYGRAAIKKRGAMIGIFKTVDRLNRCGHDMIFYDIDYRDKRVRYEDLP